MSGPPLRPHPPNPWWARLVVGLGRTSTRHPWRVIATYGLLLAVALFGATRARSEEDVLTFLPTTDVDVRLFREVSQRFGSLRVALVGVEAPPGDDLFSAEAVARLHAADRALRSVRGIERVVSLASTEDPRPTADGVDIVPLLGPPPPDRTARDELRRRVLSSEIVGHVVSADGRATLLLVFLTDGAGRDTVDELRAVAGRALAPLATHFGGAPFAAQALYDEAGRDVRRLAPLALALLLVIVLLSFRDPVGVALTTGAIAMGTIVAVGAMGLLHEPANLLTAILPVVLFASGSAFPILLLGRYYVERSRAAPAAALRAALEEVAAPLTIDTATTAIGFLAFLVMDVRPMRVFGLACGSGIVLVWLLTFTLLPAVLTLRPRGARGELELSSMGRGLARLFGWAARRAPVLVIVAALVGAVAAIASTRVQVRMAPSAFFRAGSDPWRIERLLEERFGGASFVEVEVEGELDEPETLRQLAALVEHARSLPRVTQVSSLLDPLLGVSDALGLGRQLPASAAQTRELHFFLLGQAALPTLVTPDHRRALVHVRVRGQPDDVLAALERYAHSARGDASARLRMRVSGEPALDRGFARSVARNQLRATVVAILATVLFLTLLFRSLVVALVAWLPAQLALLVLFAGLAIVGRPIDLGTALVTGVAIGVGADFGMHCLWSLRTASIDRMAREIGPPAVIAVVVIAAAFLCLALGRSPVTRLFGVLAALSAATATLFACLLLPASLALARRLGLTPTRRERCDDEDAQVFATHADEGVCANTKCSSV